MHSDQASIPTRGSRFAGLDSMIMTSVLGSAFEEQERREKAATSLSRIAVRHRILEPRRRL